MTDVVIPANNEAPTLAPILEVLRQARGVDSIIVVADNCTDWTAHIAETNGATVIRFNSEKGGKGRAMMRGLETVRTPRVMFCDADINGLTCTQVETLISCDMSGQVAGLFDHGPGNVLSAPWPPITGQRVIPTSAARAVTLKGYQAELRLDAHIGYLGLGNRHFVLSGVTNTPRSGLDVAAMFAGLTILSAPLLPGLVAYWQHLSPRASLLYAR